MSKNESQGILDKVKALLIACEKKFEENTEEWKLLDEAHGAYKVLVLDGVEPSLKPNGVSREVRSAMSITEVFMKKSAEFTREHFPNGRKLDHIVPIANVMARVYEAEIVSYYGKWRKENE